MKHLIELSSNEYKNLLNYLNDVIIMYAEVNGDFLNEVHNLKRKIKNESIIINEKEN